MREELNWEILKPLLKLDRVRSVILMGDPVILYHLSNRFSSFLSAVFFSVLHSLREILCTKISYMHDDLTLSGTLFAILKP